MECIRRSTLSKLHEGLIPINTDETLCGVQCTILATISKKMLTSWNRARAKKMIQVLVDVSYEDRLKKLGRFSLEKKKFKEDMISIFRNIKECQGKDGQK